MSKKPVLVCIGCFAVGLLLGIGGTYFLGMAYWGKQTADGLVMIRQTELAASGEKAFAAYQHESQPIAVYALSQYLASLKEAENEIGGSNPVLLTRMDIHFDQMLTHARLAKSYAAMGRSELSQQHLADALKCAALEPKLESITNQAVLTEILAKVDQRAK
jgi:hypothetical protein